MFRSPGRNQRSKGLKVRHVLQICFLVAICFWLIYQVKHSRDKRKAFDETDAKQSVRTQPNGDVIKFGRKDLNPKEEQLGSSNGKPHEEAENEETTGDEEENKNEEGTEEEAGDKDDDGGGDVVDEMDEHELEKSDAEVDREEVIEEEKDDEENGEKENKEKDAENSSDSSENENSSKEQDVEDETTKSTHEAREENYRADDASSAVTQTSQTTASEKGVESSKELAGKDGLGDDNSRLETTVPSMEGREMAENERPLNETTNDAVENVAAKFNDGSLPSASAFALSEQSNGLHQLINNTPEVNTGLYHSSVHNGTVTEADKSLLMNLAVEHTSSTDVSSAALDQVKNSSLNHNNESGSSSVPSNSKKPVSSSEEAEGNFQSSNTKSNVKIEAKADTDAKALTMDDAALNSENVDEEHHDPIDSSDSSTILEEKDDGKDLEMLANVLNEDSNEEGAAAE